MRISVFGLGYVGTVSAACLTERGNHVVGVDTNETKLSLLASGKAPIVEKGVAALVDRNVAGGRLSATSDAIEAVLNTEISIVCVGTPSATNGAIDTRAIETVCVQIGEALKRKRDAHTVVVRSTILPGTFRRIIQPALEASSQRSAGDGLGIAVNPEFLREGTAVADFYEPSKTIIGTDDAMTAQAVENLYAGLPGTVVRTSPEIAEVIKYVDNPWHALKVAFANEIGNICQALRVNSHAVMDIFLLDQKLNISPAYLRPGFAFGGSCLPKDLRAVCYLAQQLDLQIPVLRAVSESNRVQIERAVDWIMSFGRRKIAVLGCSFKEGTDDLRESPYVILIERLIGKGCTVKIFDQNIRMSMLTGANREYISSTLPHVANLMVGCASVAMSGAELVIITANAPEYVSALKEITAEQILLDFARIEDSAALGENYRAVNW